MKGRIKKPSIFVPEAYRREVFALSKAALADIAWNLAGACSESAEDSPNVMETLRSEIKVVLRYRNDEASQ